MNYNFIKSWHWHWSRINKRRDAQGCGNVYEYFYHQPGEFEDPTYRVSVLEGVDHVASIEFRYHSETRQWIMSDVDLGSHGATLGALDDIAYTLKKFNTETKCQRTIFDNVAHFLKYKLFKRR